MSGEPAVCNNVNNKQSKQGNHDEKHECRACRLLVDNNKNACDIFQPWTPPWAGMEATIAEDLAKLANIEITKADNYSKTICQDCLQKLVDACKFVVNVRKCDTAMREVHKELWPKPICVENMMDIEVKQEVISEEECDTSAMEIFSTNTDIWHAEIKIEPEEFVKPSINGTTSFGENNTENTTVANGSVAYEDEQYLDDVEMKPEPRSEGEVEEERSEPLLDLPLECMLCTKSFNSVNGLKAHVIAQHSYKTVKRKSEGAVSPKVSRDKYQCQICRRNFTTSTDLLVHETCHNKHSCYACTQKFDTFDQLTKHRRRCKALHKQGVKKPKTLEDVKRPSYQKKSTADGSETVDSSLPGLTITSFSAASIPPAPTSIVNTVIPDISITSTVSRRPDVTISSSESVKTTRILSPSSPTKGKNSSKSSSSLNVRPDISITSTVSGHSEKESAIMPDDNEEINTSSSEQNVFPDISITSTVSLQGNVDNDMMESNSESESYIIPDLDTPSESIQSDDNTQLEQNSMPNICISSVTSLQGTLESQIGNTAKNEDDINPSEAIATPKISVASFASMKPNVNVKLTASSKKRTTSSSLQTDVSDASMSPAQELISPMTESYIIPDNGTHSSLEQSGKADSSEQIDPKLANSLGSKESMKLRLEIHSSKSDSETQDLSDVEMKMKALHSDDCT